MQRYIISNKTTKKIISQGRVNIARDEEWIAEGDTSTTYGSILKSLEDKDLQVLYLPNGTFSDSETEKMNEDNTAIIAKTETDLEAEEKVKEIAEKEKEIARLDEIITAEAKKSELEAELAILKS